MSTTDFSSIERALNESQALREHAAMERARSWQERHPNENAPIDQECPFPICGDDGTVAQCVANGHCGCDERAKARPMFNFHSHHRFEGKP